MTEIEKHHGVKIFENDTCVIRIKDKPDEIMVTVNPKKDGKEYKPNGYLLGSNSLIYTKRS
jgi:hypothetical protein